MDLHRRRRWARLLILSCLALVCTSVSCGALASELFWGYAFSRPNLDHRAAHNARLTAAWVITGPGGFDRLLQPIECNNGNDPDDLWCWEISGNTLGISSASIDAIAKTPGRDLIEPYVAQVSGLAAHLQATSNPWGATLLALDDANHAPITVLDVMEMSRGDGYTRYTALFDEGLDGPVLFRDDTYRFDIAGAEDMTWRTASESCFIFLTSLILSVLRLNTRFMP